MISTYEVQYGHVRIICHINNVSNRVMTGPRRGWGCMLARRARGRLGVGASSDHNEVFTFGFLQLLVGNTLFPVVGEPSNGLSQK